MPKTKPPAPTLRERKAADTRVSLLEALLRRIDERPLADIPVKELCDEAGVSQATFFNYFESKVDLVKFFIRLWSVDMVAVVTGHPESDPLGAIEAFVVATAGQSDQNPGILAEIVGLQARHRMAGGESVTDADLLRAFPDRPELLELPRDAGLEALIPPLVQRAIALGQLSPHTDPTEVVVAVVTIFFGVAVLRRQAPDLPVEVAYGQQLQRLWRALRAEES